MRAEGAQAESHQPRTAPRGPALAPRAARGALWASCTSASHVNATVVLPQWSRGAAHGEACTVLARLVCIRPAAACLTRRCAVALSGMCRALRAVAARLAMGQTWADAGGTRRSRVSPNYAASASRVLRRPDRAGARAI